jgi:hypothetical protein
MNDDLFFLRFADAPFEIGANGASYWSELHAKTMARELVNRTNRPVSLRVHDGAGEFEIKVFEPYR